MAIFAIVGVGDPDYVHDRLKEHFPEAFYVAGNHVFFVATDNFTTRQVAERLGLSGETDEIRGVVLLVTSFYGYHDRDLWEWIQVKHRA